MEAHGTAEADLSLRSPGVGHGLEGALAVSCPRRDLLAEHHLLQRQICVAFRPQWKGLLSSTDGSGSVMCALEEKWFYFSITHGTLRSFCEKCLMPLGFVVHFLRDVRC